MKRTNDETNLNGEVGINNDSFILVMELVCENISWLKRRNIASLMSTCSLFSKRERLGEIKNSKPQYDHTFAIGFKHTLILTNDNQLFATGSNAWAQFEALSEENSFYGFKPLPMSS